eukprot:327647-Hanusia_phi.AAC.1
MENQGRGGRGEKGCGGGEERREKQREEPCFPDNNQSQGHQQEDEDIEEVERRGGESAYRRSLPLNLFLTVCGHESSPLLVLLGADSGLLVAL